MAKEANLINKFGNANLTLDHKFFMEDLEAFANLIRADEREQCAKICTNQGNEWDSDDVITNKNYAAYCAELIFARGE
jgi:hypothetical protein